MKVSWSLSRPAAKHETKLGSFAKKGQGFLGMGVGPNSSALRGAKPCVAHDVETAQEVFKSCTLRDLSGEAAVIGHGGPHGKA